MNVGNNSYLQPSKKSDDDVKLEEKAVNSLEYQKKVKDYIPIYTHIGTINKNGQINL